MPKNNYEPPTDAHVIGHRHDPTGPSRMRERPGGQALPVEIVMVPNNLSVLAGLITIDAAISNSGEPEGDATLRGWFDRFALDRAAGKPVRHVPEASSRLARGPRHVESADCRLGPLDAGGLPSTTLMTADLQTLARDLEQAFAGVRCQIIAAS
ncbi:MAG TPA: hypothetical protein VHV08_04040 [Pirellulales bacterium]|jgi:hypothetical protein|nr:hypothetical protein [Pirellulales bacterium]